MKLLINNWKRFSNRAASGQKFCSPHNGPHQNINFENRTCYFLQHDKEQDVLEGCGVIVLQIRLLLMVLK